MTTSDDDPSGFVPWSAPRILSALAPGTGGIPLKDQLRHEPSGEVLVEALRTAPADRERRILCDVLGDRHEKLAVAALVEQLDREKVRSSAADALAKIGDPAAGGALAAFFPQERAPGRRSMLAAALGAVKHRPSVPALTAALTDESESVRGSAAWSLGALEAIESIEALRTALALETDVYAQQRMSEAIDKLEARALRAT